MADGTSTYLYGLDRLGYSTSDTMYEFLPDALGSVRQVFSVAGANEGLSLAKSYDPYGNLIYSNGNDSMYGFTGEQQDGATGLVYLRARTYNPLTGTFTSRDTWDGDANLPMSYNRWAYGYSNPVKYTDPSGMKPLACIAQPDDCEDHWYGRIPDNEGIATVNYYRSSFTDDNIGNPNLTDTHIAAAIAVQSQWITGVIDTQQNNSYDYYRSIFGCDPVNLKRAMGNPGLGFGGIGIDEILDNEDPRRMQDSIKAMTRRIENKAKKCFNTESDYYCSALDKLIVIGMVQNNGYTFPDHIIKNSDDISFNFDWKAFFRGKKITSPTRDDNRAIDIGGVNFNTQFQAKLYLQNLKELISTYGWNAPDNLTISEIDKALGIVSTNYNGVE